MIDDVFMIIINYDLYAKKMWPIFLFFFSIFRRLFVRIVIDITKVAKFLFPACRPSMVEPTGVATTWIYTSRNNFPYFFFQYIIHIWPQLSLPMHQRRRLVLFFRRDFLLHVKRNFDQSIIRIEIRDRVGCSKNTTNGFYEKVVTAFCCSFETISIVVFFGG